MRSKLIKIIGSIVIGGFFLWLAFKNVEFEELWDRMSTVSFYWLPFFGITLTLSHYLRAERWRLLIVDQGQKMNRSTLFAGVMLGYVVNIFVPRLGEISRPVYVAKKQGISTGNLIGTIVAERFFDLITMFSLIMLVSFLLVSDFEILQTIFGVENWSWKQYIWIPILLMIIAAGMFLFYRFIGYLDRRNIIENPVLRKIIHSAKSFGEGMTSLKRIRRWPAFLLYTAGIWLGYIFMTYLPLFMMNMQEVYGLTLTDSIVLTIVSTIGVSVPTPGAVGSYHLFMQQSLHLLYEVPLVEALTYATVTHAATILFVLIIGPIALWWDKYYTLTHA